nr:rRNA maturation RNase YbeY [Pararhodospirillum oryzae]
MVPDLGPWVEKAARAAVEGGDPAGLDIAPGTMLDISLVLADDARVRALNATYRGKDAPTNVLSFAALDEADAPPPPPGAPLLLGDVILARETVVREAGEGDLAVADHVFHLVVHGVLHLLGYTHDTDEEAREMEGLETAILEAHGLRDPYAAAGEDRS